MISVLAFYSVDLSSNLAEVYNFYCVKLLEKNENKYEKEARNWPTKIVLPTCVILNLSRNCFTVPQQLRLSDDDNNVIEQRNLRMKMCLGGSPGLVVMGGDSQSTGCGFESRRRILDGHDIFSH